MEDVRVCSVLRRVLFTQSIKRNEINNRRTGSRLLRLRMSYFVTTRAEFSSFTAYFFVRELDEESRRPFFKAKRKTPLAHI